MRTLLWSIAASILMAACRPAPPSPDASDAEFVQTRLFAMGTWVDLVVGTQGVSADTEALAEIESLLRTFETDYYAWGDGQLGHLNEALRRGEPMRIDEPLARLLDAARTLHDQSGGTFEPGVGGLVELWGFHSALDHPRAPSADAIRAWRDARPSISDLTLTDRVATSTTTRLKLDLGGIAKGEIVDRVIDELTRRGYADVLVNAGGDLRVRGRHGARRWRVGIQAPRTDGILGSLQLEDGEAVFTSGDYERYFDSRNGRMHHILDPETGYPAAHTQAVTVLTEAGIVADAAATAIFVAGPDRWRRVAEHLGVAAVLRIDASGALEMTEAMRLRLELDAGIDPAIVVGRT